MTIDELNIPLNLDNRDPRVACVLLVDVSGSMAGAPIEALEAGFKQFVDEIQDDPVARKRAEIAVVTFGTHANLLVAFQEARALQPATFPVGGTTNMADGINLALEQIENRKLAYRAEGIHYFRPWIFLLTDGRPDDAGIEGALERLSSAERARKVTVFPVGVGEQVDWDMLGRASSARPALKLAGLRFAEMFVWLSRSLSAVSGSNAHGPDDAAQQDPAQQIPTAPIGWGSVPG